MKALEQEQTDPEVVKSFLYEFMHQTSSYGVDVTSIQMPHFPFEALSKNIPQDERTPRFYYITPYGKIWIEKRFSRA